MRGRTFVPRTVSIERAPGAFPTGVADWFEIGVAIHRIVGGHEAIAPVFFTLTQDPAATAADISACQD